MVRLCNHSPERRSWLPPASDLGITIEQTRSSVKTGEAAEVGGGMEVGTRAGAFVEPCLYYMLFVRVGLSMSGCEGPHDLTCTGFT
jgi:hypothetical protein